MVHAKGSSGHAKKSAKARGSPPVSSRSAIAEVSDWPANIAGPSSGAVESPKRMPPEHNRDPGQPAAYEGKSKRKSSVSGMKGKAPKKSKKSKCDVGNSEYWMLIRQKAPTVDKTLLIPDLLESPDYANLVLRPRRFGKSMNLSMLRAFLDVDFFETVNTNLVPRKERYDFFMTQKIGKERPDLVDEFCGRVPVLHVSLDVCLRAAVVG